MDKEKREKIEGIVAKYPVRNQRWYLSDGVFHSDASDHDRQHEGMFDPWNRNLPSPAPVITDEEGDILHWEYTTTVEGTLILLRIYND
jgi:hypothetical protein